MPNVVATNVNFTGLGSTGTASVSGLVGTIDFTATGGGAAGIDLTILDTSKSPCLVFVVESYPYPYNAPASVTFGGVACTLSPIAEGGGGQPQRSRFFAVCPFDASTTFADSLLVVTYAGSTADLFSCSASGMCFYYVDPAAVLTNVAAAVMSVQAFNGTNPDAFPLPSAVTGANGDAIVSFCGSYDWGGLAAYPTVASPSGYTAMFTGILGATSFYTSYAYRQLSGAASDTITWQVATAASGVYMALGAFDLPNIPSTGTVPDVTGEVLATAESDLTAAGFTTGVVSGAVSHTVPVGSVISQNPAGGSTATLGSPVDLVESVAAVVPDLYNLSESIAEATITAAGLTLGSVTTQADVIIIPGNVDGQNPAAGTIVAALSPVDIVVSTGRAGLVVPDLIGLTPDEANAILTTQGFVLNAVAYAASDTVQAGLILGQNPGAGSPTSYGSFVGYVVSLGAPAPLGAFDFNSTVISQYANSPTLLRLISNMAQYVDQSQNFANFYSFVWNVDTAQGFGLDIWGRIVGVSRLLQIPNSDAYVGFQDGSGPSWDVQPFDASGTFYGGGTSTQSYLLTDTSYRVLILAKALANISVTTVPAFNQLLQNLFGAGSAYVTNPGDMEFVITLNFVPTPVQLAILTNSGVIPRPAGVSFTVSHP